MRSSENETLDEAWDKSSIDHDAIDVFEIPENETAVTASESGSIADEESNNIRGGDDVYYISGQKYIVREENFRATAEDDDLHFDRIYTDFKRRHRHLSEFIHEEDYEDVEFRTYEWMLKVETEYYFRYEGTMLVPPCFEVVHWRVMKDPLRVHARQIAEINRLLAWRLDPDTCGLDSAGDISTDGNSIVANREVQYYHDQHRKVFCECKDWPSKFQSDRDWCDRWEQDVNHDRFYTRPYSFDSAWLPGNP